MLNVYIYIYLYKYIEVLTNITAQHKPRNHIPKDRLMKACNTKQDMPCFPEVQRRPAPF